MIFWIVEDGELVKYERSGSCKQCGKCCRDTRITFQFKVGAIVQEHSTEEDIREEDWSKLEGWSMFLAQGTWWYFGRFEICDEAGRKCPALEGDNLCTNWMEEDFRPICRYWPFGPSNIEYFPECGFSFTKLEE